MIEERVQKPCLGVIPYLRSLMLEEEDSLGLPDTCRRRNGHRSKLQTVRLTVLCA